MITFLIYYLFNWSIVIYNGVLVSGVQQSDSDIYEYGLLQDI